MLSWVEHEKSLITSGPLFLNADICCDSPFELSRLVGSNEGSQSKFLFRNIRAPDNFLKQGVADASLEAKGIFLQNPEVFSLPSFYTRAFLEVANIV